MEDLGSGPGTVFPPWPVRLSGPAVTVSTSDVRRNLGRALGPELLTRHQGYSCLTCAYEWVKGKHVREKSTSTVIIPRRPVPFMV